MRAVGVTFQGTVARKKCVVLVLKQEVVRETSISLLIFLFLLEALKCYHTARWDDQSLSYRRCCLGAFGHSHRSAGE